MREIKMVKIVNAVIWFISAQLTNISIMFFLKNLIFDLKP